ncbi:MAG: hypothetical protein ABIQ84_03230 [Usitatibacter sp.]
MKMIVLMLAVLLVGSVLVVDAAEQAASLWAKPQGCAGCAPPAGPVPSSR